MARFLGDSISNSFLSTVNRGLFAVRGCPRNSCVSRESQNSTGEISAKTNPIHLIYAVNNYPYLVTISSEWNARPNRQSRKMRETKHFLRVSNESGKVLQTSSLLRREERSRGIAGNLEEQKNAPRRENVPRAPRQNRGGGMEKWWAKVKRGRWGREGRWCTINFEASRREGRASVWICMQEQLATPPCGLAPR